MWQIPYEVWAAAPKDAWWWMDAAPYFDTGDDVECSGHGYCDGSCGAIPEEQDL